MRQKVYMQSPAQDWKKVKPRVRCWSAQPCATSGAQTACTHHRRPSLDLRVSSSAPGFFDVREKSNDLLKRYDSNGGSLASTRDYFTDQAAISSCSDPHRPYD